MKKIITILILIFTLSNVYSTEPTDTLHSFRIDTTGQIKLYNVDIDFLHQLIFKKFNEYRVQNGVNPCVWFKDTINGSYLHSKHMAEKDVNNEKKIFHAKNIRGAENVLCHSGIGGYLKVYDGYTPNITQRLMMTYDEFATSLLQQWINSKRHNANLLNPTRTHFEVGVYLKCELIVEYNEPLYLDDEKRILIMDSHYTYKRYSFGAYATARLH